MRAIHPNELSFMKLSAEQQIELEKFPTALQSLVTAELAAGNSIVEIGHSFPAPPVGAYIKLANEVTTRTRATLDGLSFYERNSSIYSGEFTDAKRFYFVLEPPKPPPPEPDMELIRKSMAQAPEPLSVSMTTSKPAVQKSPKTKRKSETTPARIVSVIETDSGAIRSIYFLDNRSPSAVQFAMEQTLMTLFTPSMEDDQLCLRAKSVVVGAKYDFQLRFEAALKATNCYSLQVEVSWGNHSEDNREYYRKTAGSWFDSWTREFTTIDAVPPSENCPERYRQLCDEALAAHQQLNTVEAIQQTIIAAMKRGAYFGTSHKEGGTKIYWAHDRFIRSDYGDDPDYQNFTDDSPFLTMLYQFCSWNVNRNSGKEPLSELDTWRLIFRSMDSGAATCE